MKATMTQQILAKKLGIKATDPTLKSGNLVLVEADTALSNDVTAPVAIDVFNKSGCALCDSKKVTFVLDHFTPNRDIQSAKQCKIVRDFARANDVKNFFDVGEWA